MLERWWTSKTEAGRKVKAIEDGLAGGLARDALDEQDMKAYLDMREIFSQLAWSPEGLERRAKYEAQFRKDNLLEGFYFQEQCEAVWVRKTKIVGAFRRGTRNRISAVRIIASAVGFQLRSAARLDVAWSKTRLYLSGERTCPPLPPTSTLVHFNKSHSFCKKTAGHLKWRCSWLLQSKLP